jgi:hypothetical protein
MKTSREEDTEIWKQNLYVVMIYAKYFVILLILQESRISVKNSWTFFEGPNFAHTNPKMQYLKYCDILWPILVIGVPRFTKILLKDKALFFRNEGFIYELLRLQVSSN